jgi:uncharacterized protein YhbP (UPF0306 family)
MTARQFVVIWRVARVMLIYLASCVYVFQSVYSAGMDIITLTLHRTH